MLDKKELRESILPVNRHVSVLFEEIEERKSSGGILIPSTAGAHEVTFKGERIYKVKMLKKAQDCWEHIPSEGYGLIHQLSGFGIRTVEPGYVKIVNENSILMTSKTKDFTEESIVPGKGRALVRITSKMSETESGIIVPKDATMNVSYDAATLGGQVISVSRDITWLKPGMNIRFDCYMGTEIFIGGQEYRLVLEDEIIAQIL